MFRQLNFRSFFNFLGRNRLYAFINIFGLSVSLMFVILIADYTLRQSRATTTMPRPAVFMPSEPKRA